jgi:SHAQKYF class myb-like DNA-binding protein
MTITKRVRQQMLDGDAEDAVLIRLDPHPAHAGKAGVTVAPRVPQGGSVENTNTNNTSDSGSAKVGQAWSAAEHERFLEALAMYPSGPWKLVAAHVGTRTTRQTMTHAQKYRQKIERQRRRSSQQQQVQQQAPKEEVDTNEAVRARAAIMALQQAADVFHAAGSNDSRPERADPGASKAGDSFLKPNMGQLNGDRARSLLLAEASKVKQAVVSLIQLAEPTALVGRLSTSRVESIGSEPNDAAVPSA